MDFRVIHANHLPMCMSLLFLFSLGKNTPGFSCNYGCWAAAAQFPVHLQKRLLEPPLGARGDSCLLDEQSSYVCWFLLTLGLYPTRFLLAS